MSLFLACAACVLAFAPTYSVRAATNVLANGDAEEAKEDEPLFWRASIFKEENLETADAEFSYLKDPDPKRNQVLHIKYS
jgi:hypothetical protein